MHTQGDEANAVWEQLEDLIRTYEAMLKATRSKIRRECLENVIEDLKTALREAQ